MQISENAAEAQIIFTAGSITEHKKSLQKNREILSGRLDSNLPGASIPQDHLIPFVLIPVISEK